MANPPPAGGTGAAVPVNYLESSGAGATMIPAQSGGSPAATPPSGPLTRDGTVIMETGSEFTSATDIVSTQTGAYLVGLILRGGALPGWLQVLLDDNVYSAILPVAPSGLDATGATGPGEVAFYPMSVGPLSGTTAIPSGAQTFGGGLVSVQGVFSSQPNPHARHLIGPSAAVALRPLRGIAVTGSESATTGTARTYTVPGGNTVQPRAFASMFAIASGTATGIPRAQVEFAAQAPFTATYKVPSVFDTAGKPPRLWPVPKIGPAGSYSLTHKALSLGAATTIQVAGYLFL